jgi:AcrR family transcriptional regulator
MKQGLECRILAAAWQQICLQGIMALNMDGLASQLAISKKTLYKLFGSKQNLVIAACQARAAVRCQRLHELLSHPTPGHPVWLAAVRQFYTDLRGEIPASVGQELVCRAPELWQSREQFVTTAIQLLLDYQLRAAQAAAERSDAAGE